MNKFRFALNTLAIAVFCLAISSVAQAQASRTWVSGTGDDANPCSRTAPCKTFAGAISKTAAGGEIDCLDAGGFGAVTITKSITIDGGNAWMAGILAAGTTGVIINAGTADVVTLRNLSINGFSTGLNGVRILAAKTVNVDKCVIYKFRGTASSRGITDERSTGANNQLFVSDSIIRDNSQTGIAVIAGGGVIIKASIRNTQVLDNGTTGLVAGSGSRVTVSSSVAAGNGSFGFAGEGPAAGSELNLENCVASGNGTGVSAATGGAVRISNNHITGNNTGLAATGGTYVTYGNNKVNGNGNGNTVPGAPAPIGPQ